MLKGEEEEEKKGMERNSILHNFTTQICQYLYVKNIHGLIALSVPFRS